MWDFCEENRSESFSSMVCPCAVLLINEWAAGLNTNRNLGYSRSNSRARATASVRR
jgi:hypothetical protein